VSFVIYQSMSQLEPTNQAIQSIESIESTKQPSNAQSQAPTAKFAFHAHDCFTLGANIGTEQGAPTAKFAFHARYRFTLGAVLWSPDIDRSLSCLLSSSLLLLLSPHPSLPPYRSVRHLSIYPSIHLSIYPSIHQASWIELGLIPDYAYDVE